MEQALHEVDDEKYLKMKALKCALPYHEECTDPIKSQYESILDKLKCLSDKAKELFIMSMKRERQDNAKKFKELFYEINQVIDRTNLDIESESPQANQNNSRRILVQHRISKPTTGQFKCICAVKYIQVGFLIICRNILSYIM